MKCEYFDFTSTNGALIPAVIWQPEEVRAILLVAHGTTEHIGRYESFAAAMARYGVAVAGFDLRGHGHHPGDPRVAALRPGDWQASLEDLGALYDHLGREFPGTPRFLLGFSLGSFLIRDLLNEGCRPDGTILAGTGYQPRWLLSIMGRIVAGQVKKVGFDQSSALVHKLAFGVYNDKFKPTRTDVDWLSTDEGAVDAYLADPLTRRTVSAGLFRELLGSMERNAVPRVYDRWDKEMPVLLISGSEDPVGDAGKGVATVRRQMEQSGIRDVTMELIPGARHAILMGDDPDPMKIIGDWLAARLGEGGR